MCSRRVGAQELSKSELWWHGPRFLKASEAEWPRSKIEPESEVSTEVKTTYIVSRPSRPANVRSHDITWNLEPTNWSSWKRLTHVLAWVLRFVRNSQRHSGDLQVGLSLMPEEVEEALRCLIQDVQRKEFREEYAGIRERTLPRKSRLLKLMPKVDNDGILRCDGRLGYAKFLPYDVRFPIILPRGCWVTKLIVKHYHEIGRHITGTNHTLGNLSTKFWIVADREEIREWENECNECKKRRAKAARQVMAPLPRTRLRLHLKSFTGISVDFGGPFIAVQGKGKRQTKRWLCLFTC